MNPIDELRTEGYVVLNGLADAAGLGRLRAVVAGLEAAAAEMTRSTDDFVLEAEGVGGWVAWQQGTAAVPGTLRSVSRVHVHRPELVRIAADLGLPGKHVEPAVGTPVELINTFLWAKPARVGSEKPWHQDMAFAPDGFTDRHGNVVTVWVAIDPATRENGCLEFYPGSHRGGLLPHVGDEERTGDGPRLERPVEPHIDAAALPADSTPVRVPLAPGSAVMFDGRIVHRSAPNSAGTPRRAISFVYALPRDGN
ncbi:phytanoyl-CoA dioxygenase family protein [Actinoallomurus soli]|uniref:phytanoyl-CoA dioxygenase family protein n=1 Tax=Actinoallomurus soli TaxID=2952535 RepID=UPI002092E2B7|nr:phytanoyl-CoA dioxygenase family protein [Actinoallomurus soli]MCO5971407.1 phytanoyl-CoA dioxygenase family protein [Actinoallomurus soli]